MAKTAPGSLSRGLEFEIIGDYTHPSPFLKKKKKKKEICLIPPSGAATEGAQGRLASITSLKKAQNIRNQEEPWPRLAGKKASWPANKRCWVWSGRGRRHLAVDHSGQWGHRWPAGLRVELSWKMGGGSREFSVDLRLWAAAERSRTLLPTTSSPSLTALTDGSQSCIFDTISLSFTFLMDSESVKFRSFTDNLTPIIIIIFFYVNKVFHRFYSTSVCTIPWPVTETNRGNPPTLQVSEHIVFLFETSPLNPCVDPCNRSLVSSLHLKFELIDHIDHLESFALIKCCRLGQVHTEPLSAV